MTSIASDLPEIEFEQTTDEDDEIFNIPGPKRKVYTAQGDPEIDSLYNKHKRGKLLVQPEFQRQFVWDVAKASRLIESALLDIPLPVIYLSEDPDGKEIVIDGQQRLTAFFSFIDGAFPDRRDFRLGSLKVFTELNGKMFKDLDEDLQDKIRYYKVRTITFQKESEADLRFEVFERLNSGAVPLNAQELRNCVFRGAYNQLLKNLAQDPDFRYLLGEKGPDKRMKDVELVLRFAAFQHATYLNYRSPVTRFLNDDLQRHQHIGEADATALRERFKNAVTLIRSLLDQHAFKRFNRGDARNPNGHWEPKKFNASLYDILMFSMATADKNAVHRNLDAIREALVHLMTADEEFIASIELSTSSVQAVTTRFDKWRSTLTSILGVGQKEPRCFSRKLKEELYTADPTCAICNQRISSLDDAAVDHVEQYWLGGRTIPENARLTHRFCNWSRPRKE